MTFSYNASLISKKDQVRFAIGDTDAADVLVQDEEIQAMLDSNGDSVARASIRCCGFLVAKYTRLASVSVGDTSIQAGELADHFRALRKDLTRDGGRSGSGMPYAGGISRSDKESRETNTDRVRPAFSRGSLPRTYRFGGDGDWS